ncbi:MAG: YihY/virulence factor BrkB family protein [Chloroflexi bacterium]|nr:YihY/virulence factor BrkB family protein [Chloroflexota bacterium]
MERGRFSRWRVATAVGTRVRDGGTAAVTRLDAFSAGRLLRTLVREIGDDDVFGMAAEMAYRFLFAVFPLLLFLATALGFVGDALGFDDLFAGLLRQVNPLLPDPVNQTLNQYVAGLLGTRSSAFLTVGLVGTLWGAAGGVGTLIKALNRAYDVEHFRPFWRRQLLALVVTVTLPPIGLALFILAVLGRKLAVWLGDALGLGYGLVELMALARWPVLVLLLVVGLSLLYHVLPNTRHRYVWSLPGSIFATAGWLLLTQGFSLYVANFGKYDATYGSFGAAIAFLLWLYLVGVVVLLGAEINALLEPTQRKHWRALGSPTGAADQPPPP